MDIEDFIKICMTEYFEHCSNAFAVVQNSMDDELHGNMLKFKHQAEAVYSLVNRVLNAVQDHEIRNRMLKLIEDLKVKYGIRETEKWVER